MITMTTPRKISTEKIRGDGAEMAEGLVRAIAAGELAVVTIISLWWLQEDVAIIFSSYWRHDNRRSSGCRKIVTKPHTVESHGKRRPLLLPHPSIPHTIAAIAEGDLHFPRE